MSASPASACALTPGGSYGFALTASYADDDALAAGVASGYSAVMVTVNRAPTSGGTIVRDSPLIARFSVV